MTCIRMLVVVLGLAAVSTSAFAELLPRPGSADSRMRNVVYRANDVVAIDAALGVSTMVVLADDEKIETVAVGDSVSWKVEPNKKGNVIFIKPIEANAETNMNVVSDKRVYSFILRTKPDGSKDQTFVVKFTYSDNDERLMAAARQMANTPNFDNLDLNNANTDYQFRGDAGLRPTIVFDDGVKTWFKFSGSLPAIFAVEAGGVETLVNHRREGEYIVVDKVTRQWMIRRGLEATCLYNMRVPPLGTVPAFSTVTEARS
jgi:P-type conjugative transfer protein VirB9